MALFALGVGLPLAGLGALTEAIQQRAAANAVGLLGMIAVGAGLLATALRPGASFERWLRISLGGLLFGHGSRLWLQTSGGGWMQPTAYGVAALILMFWEFRRCSTGAPPKKT
ncbi:MAG: hypothetical protein JSR82_15640 [Verrucomicrobia bacterium]|nr:hypothetical protein [Verrucomicrobiota bacterium]